MSERATSDAEVQRVVRSVRNEATLRECVKTWAPADVLYGIDHLEVHRDRVDWSWQREIMLPLLREIRREKEDAVARALDREASERRYEALVSKIEGLKKPHWSIVPNFVVTLAILVLTAIGAIAAVLALRR